MDFTQAASAEQLARELLVIIPRLNRVIAHELRAEFGDDATIAQMRVLGELAEAPLTLSGLARKREVSLQAASEHVQDLVERGWVTRTPDPNDRRQALLNLSPAGLSQLEQVRAHIIDCYSPLLERLTLAEAEGFHAGMVALRRVLDDQVNPI